MRGQSLGMDIDWDRLEELKKAGCYDEALAHVEHARAVPDAPDPELALEAGHCSRLLGNFRYAEECYEGAQAEAELIGDDLLLLDAMLGLASCYRAVGRLPQALGVLAECRDLADELDDQDSLPYLDWLEGTTLRFSGDLSGAMAVLKSGLQLAIATNDREGQAYLLAACGGCARTAADFLASESYYRRAYELFLELNDAFGLAYTACGRANAARMQSDFDQAETHYSEASNRYHEFGDKVSYAYTLWAWATLAKLQGDLDTASGRLAAADELFAETGDIRGRGYVALAQLEIRLLAGADPHPVAAAAARLADDLRSSGFQLEAAYANLLARLAVDEDPGDALELIERSGSSWRPDSLPLNMP